MGQTGWYDGDKTLSADAADAQPIDATRTGNVALDGPLVLGAVVDPTPVAVANTAVPVVTGSPVVGSTLTATAGTWDPASVTTAFQWLADGVPIAGATDAAYVVTAGEQGKALSARVTASAPDHTDGVASSEPTAPVTGAPIANTAVPTISGAATVGGTLTATAGTWEPSSVATAFQWRAGGSVLPGETAATLVLGEELLGEVITVTVEASKTGWSSASATSAATAAVAAGTVANSAAPVITGDAVVGSTLSVTDGTWSPATVTVTRRWLADGVAISGATASTYTLTAAEVGKKITVEATAARTGWTSGVAISEETAAVAPAPLHNTVAPAISGSAAVGSSLTSDTGTWTETGLSFTRQWFRGTTPIDGATAASYAVTSADLGEPITVKVTASKPGHVTETVASAPTAAVEPGAMTVSVTVSGTVKVGKTVTANATVSQADAALAYQWLSGGVAISGATAKTYAIPASLAAKKLSVRVTATKASYGTASGVSAATTVAAGTFTFSTAPRIVGTAAVGKILKYGPPTMSPAATTVRYQWKRNGAAISRATASSYKLVRGDRGRRITLTITYIRAGYTTVVKTTAATAKVR
ncbi:hypothetical protein [Nocardioides cavernaquae]|uniref:hypothetical protein n=1 Tax=Nocardioides cavernaquae TaxID=2321396 RepID=UPI00160324AC|nr:hypothetical protein [Nocardioides cavernaquae]